MMNNGVYGGGLCLAAEDRQSRDTSPLFASYVSYNGGVSYYLLATCCTKRSTIHIQIYLVSDVRSVKYLFKLHLGNNKLQVKLLNLVFFFSG